MRALALDTSSKILGVAATEDGRVRRWQETAGELRHIEEAAPTLARVMTELDWNMTSLDAIFVAGGPGSFTGLRIGIATAKGLEVGGEIAVVAVPTLEALAATELMMAGASGGHTGLLVPNIDARAGRRYAAIFRTGASGNIEGAHPIPSLERLTEDLDIGMDELTQRVLGMRDGDEDILLVDDENDCASAGSSVVLGLAVLGYRRYLDGDRLAPGAGPTYIRETNTGGGGGVPRFQDPSASPPGV